MGLPGLTGYNQGTLDSLTGDLILSKGLTGKDPLPTCACGCRQDSVLYKLVV